MKSTKIEKLFVVLALISSFLFVGLERSQAVTYCPVGYTVNGTNCEIVTTYSAGSLLSFDALIVAGGGAGRNEMGGGGGAGGVLSVTGLSSSSSFSVVVGGGVSNANGSNSSLGSNIAIGGGAGGASGAVGSGGGSGGGAGRGAVTGGTATSGQGFSGGVSGGNAYYDLGGSGGGAGAVGTGRSNTSTTANNAGGMGTNIYSAWGLATSTGQNVGGVVYYAGGGGVGGYLYTGTGAAAGSAGGLGGGGSGGTSPAGSTNDSAANGGGSPGLVNSGGGGAGGSAFNGSGAIGGSGVVIVRYVATVSAGSGGVVSIASPYVYHAFKTVGTSSFILSSSSCNAGDSLTGSTCTHTVTLAGTTPGARCPAGSHDDPNDVTKCIKDGGSIAPAVAPISTPSCSTGYILTAGSAGVYTCITGVASYTATTFTTYTCPTGGTLTGTLCIVTGTVNNQSYNATSQNNYTCPTGGTLTGTLCIVAKTLILTYAATLTTKTTYTCANGGSLSGSICTISNGNLLYTTPATTGTHWACPNGYWDSQFGNCTNGSSSTAFIYPVTYLCSYGGTLSGTTCYFYVDQQYSATGDTTSTYSCANTAELSGTNCLAYSVGSQYSANYVGTSYTCPQGGDLSGSVCILSTSTSSSQYNATSTPSLSCPKGGSLSGSVCGFTQSSISVTLTYTGSCLLYYTFNQSTQLCDPVSYPYVNNIAPVLVGVYLCYTYSDGNLLYSNYYGYDASSPGITFSRACSLQSNVEGSVNDEAGYYYCEILDRTTQEITSIVLATDITGFKENRSTTCTFTTSTDDDTTGEELNPLMESALDVCNIVNLISQSFASYITCQIDLNK